MADQCKAHFRKDTHFNVKWKQLGCPAEVSEHLNECVDSLLAPGSPRRLTGHVSMRVRGFHPTWASGLVN